MVASGGRIKERRMNRAELGGFNDTDRGWQNPRSAMEPALNVLNVDVQLEKR